MNLDNSTKELIENFSDNKLTVEEWSSVRQCLRCLINGDRIVNKKVVKNFTTQKYQVLEAVNMIINLKKDKQLTVLEAARELAFVKE